MQPTQRRLANAIRALAMDAVEAANSGHPGMPMGMADAATALFTKHLKFDPADPHWPDRDRFVLSAGHGSMLIYALLYLTGYARPTLDDIKRFRQLGSARAPATPRTSSCRGSRSPPDRWGRAWRWRSGWRSPSGTSTPSTATSWSTTGPSSSPATADLMEGVNHEAVGLAGHLKLGRLIVLWDDNSITIDGSTDLSRNEDVIARYQADRLAYGRMRRPRRRQVSARRSTRLSPTSGRA